MEEVLFFCYLFPACLLLTRYNTYSRGSLHLGWELAVWSGRLAHVDLGGDASILEMGY